MQYYSEFRLELAVPLQLLDAPSHTPECGARESNKVRAKIRDGRKNFPRQFLHAHVAVVADFFVSNPPAFVNVSPLTNHIRKNEHVRLNNRPVPRVISFPALRAGFTSLQIGKIPSITAPGVPQELLPFPRGGSCEMESCQLSSSSPVPPGNFMSTSDFFPIPFVVHHQNPRPGHPGEAP